ncbi:hypothetical protein D9756_010545 [Leucocoprinus leucothites]|uniref:Uncharacterized protein n=1 Tax=Leucocoprinus leucothites TaxID=201217 RepID=A0A8H5CX65_9AGAR|nr:hypothetical protein D9756_010545 [Leucoagaricus leucothites]
MAMSGEIDIMEARGNGIRYPKQVILDRGDFPRVVQNGSEAVILDNPWANATKSAPFDQPFYLILNVAVGGTNGWFPDRSGEKPWLDGSNTAMGDFWRARQQWQPTWSSDPEDRSLVVYVVLLASRTAKPLSSHRLTAIL